MNSLVLALTGCLFVACSGQNTAAVDEALRAPDVPAVQSAPDPAQIAGILCQYTAGGFPNWAMYPQYAEFLAPGEEEAIAYMANELAHEANDYYRPRYRALAEFVWSKTHCELAEPTKDGQNPRFLPDGAIVYTFEQNSPIVPKIPDIAPTEENTERSWLQLLNAHYQGRSFSRSLYIVLDPDGLDGYVMRSDIRHQYMEPLSYRKMWQALERLDLEKAKKLHEASCARRERGCRDFKPYYEAVLEDMRFTSALFTREVTMQITDKRMVQMSGNSRYTAIRLNLTNHGQRTYRDIALQADGRLVQRCKLQHSRDYLDQSPLTLHPGMEAVAYCILSENTMPDVKLHVLMADVEPQL